MMCDVGGIIEFVPERHQSWYERMVKPGDGCNVYCLVYNEKTLASQEKNTLSRLKIMQMRHTLAVEFDNQGKQQ